MAMPPTSWEDPDGYDWPNDPGLTSYYLEYLAPYLDAGSTCVQLRVRAGLCRRGLYQLVWAGVCALRDPAFPLEADDYTASSILTSRKGLRPKPKPRSQLHSHLS